MRIGLGIAAMVSASVVASAVAPAAGAAPHRNPVPPGVRFVPGQAIVRYERGTVASERSKAREDAGVRLQRLLAVARGELVAFEGPVAAAVARLNRQPHVAYAQPNYRYRASDVDSFLAQQWGLGAGPGVEVAPAWNRTRGAGETIAVLDTGVDLTHPDLAGNLVPGWDFVSNDSNPDDYHYHGTHVAGIAAAVAGNGRGIAGVAPASKVLPVRVLDGDGTGSTSDIAPAIQWAADQGAGVINMSLGGPPAANDQLLVDAVAYADTKDAVVVVAAGNEAEDNDIELNMPCSIDAANLICVAALRSDGSLAGYSNFGDETVDVGAPGSSILSAKTDWGSPLFSDSFESALTAWAPTAWERVLSSNGTNAATDSPDGNYLANSYSPLVKASVVSLAGQRGCRIHFLARYDIAAGPDAHDEFDYFFAGADTNDPNLWDGVGLFDSTGGQWERTAASISDLDGRTDVKPTFEVAANNDGSQADGAYVDDAALSCRDQTYADAVVSDPPGPWLPTGGSYISISGTSMATPHVAGVAALVRAADPGATNDQVVEAIKTGAKPQPSLTNKTVTGGRADALGAIEAALGQPNPPPTSATTPSTTAAKTSSQAPPTRPGPAGFPSRYRVGRRGWITIRVVGDTLLRGTFTLHAGPRRRVILKASFRTSSRGSAVARERLNRAGRRLLRRARGRLRARVTVVLTNASALRSVTTQNRVLLATRRRR